MYLWCSYRLTDINFSNLANITTVAIQELLMSLMLTPQQEGRAGFSPVLDDHQAQDNR